MSNGVNGAQQAPQLNGNGSSSSSIGGTPSTGGANNGTTNKHLNGAQHGRMDRKTSSPMMPAFMVSAPGKVIVFGEHAVVHGKVRPVESRLGEAPVKVSLQHPIAGKLTSPGAIHRPPSPRQSRSGPTSS